MEKMEKMEKKVVNVRISPDRREKIENIVVQASFQSGKLLKLSDVVNYLIDECKDQEMIEILVSNAKNK